MDPSIVARVCRGRLVVMPRSFLSALYSLVYGLCSAHPLVEVQTECWTCGLLDHATFWGPMLGSARSSILSSLFLQRLLETFPFLYFQLRFASYLVLVLQGYVLEYKQK